MRREELKVHGEAISPPIHSTIENELKEHSILGEISDQLDAGIKSMLEQHTGAYGTIQLFRQVTYHVSLFYGLFLRTMTQTLDTIRLSEKKQPYEQTEDGKLVHQSVFEKLRLRDRIHLKKYDDIRGRFPLIGRWENLGDFSDFRHSAFDQKIHHDVSLTSYIDQWDVFHNEFAQNSGMTKRQARVHLRSLGLGEIQAWIFWRYFTGRSLKCKYWTDDFPVVGAEYKREAGEEKSSWGKRVWEKMGGQYSHSIEDLDLSTPDRAKPCAFSLGCVQNLDFKSAEKANHLSWELEHSRPKSWGGNDHDLQAMCTHHNRLKGDNFMFDVHTFAKMVTLHRHYDLMFPSEE